MYRKNNKSISIVITTTAKKAIYLFIRRRTQPVQTVANYSAKP